MNLEQKPFIRIAHLTKQYEGVDALRDVSFDIQEGESYGIVGPNGAGKTTLIRMLCALIPVSDGLIEYNGRRISFSDRDVHYRKKNSLDLIKFRQEIGFVPQKTALDEKLTAWENLEFEAQLYHIKPIDVVDEIGQLLHFFQLDDRSSIPVKAYSGGMKRRLELARALMHQPHLLILDEPTVGLDPAAKLQIWQHLRTLQSTQKITTIISTNNMEEAEVLCDYVAILDQGILIAYGTPAELKSRVPGDIVNVEVDPQDGDTVNVVLQQFSCGEVQGSSVHLNKFLRFRPGAFKCYVDSGEIAVRDIYSYLGQQGVVVSSIWQQKPTLDDVFIYFTQQETDIDFDQIGTLEQIIKALGLTMKKESGMSDP